jgi:translation initiation factor 6 (eIF-6)
MSESKSAATHILGLQLKQETIKKDNLKEKIGKYEGANEIVPNTVAQQDINDLWTELETTEIEIEIIETQLTAIDNLDR